MFSFVKTYQFGAEPTSFSVDCFLLPVMWCLELCVLGINRFISKWVNAQTPLVQREAAAVQTHIYLHIVHHSITCAEYTTVCTLLPVLSFPCKTSSVQLHKGWFDVTSRP